MCSGTGATPGQINALFPNKVLGENFKTSVAMLHGGGGNFIVNHRHSGLRLQYMFMSKKRKKKGGWNGC